jgi:hypothetical protein
MKLRLSEWFRRTVSKAVALAVAAPLSLGACGAEPAATDLEIRVVATMTNGRRADLYLDIRDPMTRSPVKGLTLENFATTETGTDLGREVLVDLTTDNPLNVAVLLDLSSSLPANSLDGIKRGAKRLVEAAPGGSAFGVYRFAELVERLGDLSTDATVVNEQIDAAVPYPADRGGRFSNLYGATAWAASDAATTRFGVNARRPSALVVLANGRDNVGDTTSIQVGNALRKSNVIGYAVALGPDIADIDLEWLSITGRPLRADDASALESQFTTVGADLSSLYRLRYETPKREGEVAVKVNVTDGVRTGVASATFTPEFNSACEFKVCDPGAGGGVCGTCAPGLACLESGQICAALEPADEMAGQLVAERKTTGRIADTRDTKTYWFWAERGIEYRVATEDPGSFTGSVTLLAPDGSTVVERGLARDGIEWVASSSATFFVRLQTGNPDAIGGYTLRLTRP